MALAQVTIMANQVESARIGHQAISLTEFASNLEPEIAAGSVVEVGGALYEAALDEAIAGLAAIAPSSDVYIKLTVAGASVTASATVVAPTWDETKYGWYSGAERYIGGLYKDAGGNYTLKYLFDGHSIIQAADTYFTSRGALVAAGGIDSGASGVITKKAIIVIGDWNMDTTQFLNIAHGLNGLNFRVMAVTIRNDANTQRYQLEGYDHLTESFEGGGIEGISAANISIWRKAGGYFDNVDFDSVGYNRGWIAIEYEA